MAERFWPSLYAESVLKKCCVWRLTAFFLAKRVRVSAFAHTYKAVRGENYTSRRLASTASLCFSLQVWNENKTMQWLHCPLRDSGAAKIGCLPGCIASWIWAGRSDMDHLFGYLPRYESSFFIMLIKIGKHLFSGWRGGGGGGSQVLRKRSTVKVFVGQNFSHMAATCDQVSHILT